MKLIVYLINRPQFDVETLLPFLASQKTSWNRSPNATEAEEIVEVAGRLCYMSFGPRQSPKTNQAYIKHLITMGHDSVLEHVNWTFLLEGVSRGFSHQLVRHRVGFAFSQLSQQYHDEREAQFIEPTLVKKHPEAKDTWKKAINTANESYQELMELLKNLEFDETKELDKKETKRAIFSAARSVLPNATDTKVLVTGNARALRHFLKIRGGIPGRRRNEKGSC